MSCPAFPPEPIFIGIEETQKDRHATARAYEEGVDMLEIDLDEDGPLREEYLPRRRVSGSGQSQSHRRRDSVHDLDARLPPPARWSPEADEPLIFPRELQGSRQYHAPQAIVLPPLIQAPPPPLPFHQVLDSRHSTWLSHYPPKLEQGISPDHGVSAMYNAVQPLVHYGYNYPAVPGHSRSQSLSYSQVVGDQAHNRLRSLSQTYFDPGYSDIRLSENHFLPPPVMSRWSPARQAVYPPFYDRPFDCHSRPLKV